MEAQDRASMQQQDQLKKDLTNHETLKAELAKASKEVEYMR